MNSNWSQYIQLTEELYQPRSLRFNDKNKDLWLSAIGVKDGMTVLEIGCAGGIFCHRIKTYLPNVKITGLDFDIGHIKWAIEKTKQLNLECDFINGDATSMPFDDNTFDLCYSYTVMEHIPTVPFLNEQRRVLKSGGRISVLSVRTRLNLKCDSLYAGAPEEMRLLEKAWAKAGNYDAEHNIGGHDMTEHEYPKALEKAGFHDVKAEFLTVVDYAPDNADVSEETALLQINTRRILALANAEKALNIAPDSLSDNEKETLNQLINQRFDKRIDQYKNGEKLWDFSTSTALIVSGIK